MLDLKQQQQQIRSWVFSLQEIILNFANVFIPLTHSQGVSFVACSLDTPSPLTGQLDPYQK